MEYTLRLILGVSYSALKEIVERFQTRNSLLIRKEKARAIQTSITLPGGELQKAHKKYLIKRGFDPDYLERKYRLQGTGPVGDWKFRIIIPIFYKGQLVSFQGRAIREGMVRYKTLEVEDSVISAKDVLYNIDTCSSDKIIIVEGPFDVMRLGDGVAGTLGIEMTPQQIELIASRFSKAVFLFDPEYDAQKRAEKQGSELSALGVDISIIDTELDHDPGDMSEDEVKYIRNSIGV